MTDDLESRLREALPQLVPPPPPDLALVAGARRYARRSRVLRSAAAVAAVVLVGGGGILYAATGLESNQGQPASPTNPTTSASGDNPIRPYVCGDPWLPPPATTSRDGVSPGAISVRLCPVRPQDPTGMGGNFSAPDDALTTGIDGLVRAVNDTQPTGDGFACDGVTGPTYSLVFQYADGSLQAVQADSGNCDLLAAENFGLRYGARHVFAEYMRALLKQRQHTDPPSLEGRWTGCPDTFADGRLSIVPLGSDVRFVRAVVCDYGLAFPDLTGTATLSEHQLAQFNADLAHNVVDDYRPTPACPASADAFVSRMVFGYNQWGDLIGVYGGGCSGYRLYPDLRWLPTPATEQMLDSLSTQP
jgi:hypothetical protein